MSADLEEEEEKSATQAEAKNGDGEEEGPRARVPAPPEAGSPRAALPLVGGRWRSRPPQFAALRAPGRAQESRPPFPMGSARRAEEDHVHPDAVDPQPAVAHVPSWKAGYGSWEL